MTKEKITYKEIDVENLTKKQVNQFLKKLFDLEKIHYSYKDNPLLEKYHLESFRNDLKKGTKFFFVFSGDVLVGRARVNVFNKELSLKHLLIHPEYQNKGFGKRLMIRILGYSKKHKLNNVVFNVSNYKTHAVSKAVVSRNQKKSSTKYKYIGNTKYVNHDVQSVISIKKEKPEISKKTTPKRPGK